MHMHMYIGRKPKHIPTCTQTIQLHIHDTKCVLAQLACIIYATWLPVYNWVCSSRIMDGAKLHSGSSGPVLLDIWLPRALYVIELPRELGFLACVETHLHIQYLQSHLKLLQLSTTPTMFFPISWTSPFTVARMMVPIYGSWRKWKIQGITTSVLHNKIKCFVLNNPCIYIIYKPIWTSKGWVHWPYRLEALLWHSSLVSIGLVWNSCVRYNDMSLLL